MLKNALSAKSLPTLKPGKYRDGEGLQFEVKGKSRRWTFTYYLNSKAHELAIGGYPAMSLSAAREKRAVLRDAKDKGIDPRRVLTGTVSETTTFLDDTASYIAHASGRWSTAHATEWTLSMQRVAGPLMRLPTASLTQADVLAVLGPVWTSQHVTAERVMNRIGAVIKHAMAVEPARFVGAANPCAGLTSHLPRVASKVDRRPAMPWRDLPEFYQKLKSRPEPAAAALRFLLLTCCPRVSEVVRAESEEIYGNRWNVPAEHMKSGKARTIPLSLAAQECLSWVDSGGPRLFDIDVNSMQELLRDVLKQPYTVHGFRSSFMDWVAEVHPAKIMEAERALDHNVGNQVQRAYLRTDMFDQRSLLADLWAEFLGA